MSQPWANHHVRINRLFFPSIICVSSPSLCSPPSHHHGRKNTHVKFPGPAAILRCRLLCQNPNLGKVRANPARLCFTASCPTCYCSSQHPATGMCHLRPSLSSQPASSSTAGCQKWLWHWGGLICLPSSLVLQGEDQNNLTSGCTLLLCRFMSCLSSTVFICFINHLWANIADTCSAHPPRSPRESARSLVDCTLFQLVRLESNLAGVAWSLGCPVIPHSCPKSHQSQLPGKQTRYISIWSVRGLGFFFQERDFCRTRALASRTGEHKGGGFLFSQPHVLTSASVIYQFIFWTKLPPAGFWSTDQAEISAGKIYFTALSLSFHIWGPPVQKSLSCSTEHSLFLQLSSELLWREE